MIGGMGGGNRPEGECRQCGGHGYIYARTSYHDKDGRPIVGLYKSDESIKCDVCEGFGDAGSKRAWRQFKYGQTQSVT